jgi:hypothetical protein
MARVSKVRRSPQAVACGKRNVGELGKPQRFPPWGQHGTDIQLLRHARGNPDTELRWNPKPVGTTRLGYTGIEAMTGKLENGTNLEPTILPENHVPGGRKAATNPWGVLSDIVLGGGESPLHGEGSDGSTQFAKETRAGQVGLELHEPTSLRATAIGWILPDAHASTTEEPDAGKLHVRVRAGGAG